MIELLTMARLSIAVLAMLAASAAQAQTPAQPQAQPARKPAAQPAQQPAARQSTPVPAPAAAAQNVPTAPRPLGTFEAWTAIEMVERSGKICYMVARPSQAEPRTARRGEIMMTISHRPGQNQQNQVSYQAGYPYKGGAPVVVEVERRKFELFTRPEVDADTAWTPDAAADKAIVEAMRAGKSVTVKGVSSRGTETTDVIQLAGFTKALGEINKACGVR